MWGNQSKTDPFGKTFYPVNANAFFIACLLSQFEAITMKCQRVVFEPPKEPGRDLRGTDETLYGIN